MSSVMAFESPASQMEKCSWGKVFGVDRTARKRGNQALALLTFSETALCIEAQWLERRNKMRKQDPSA